MWKPTSVPLCTYTVALSLQPETKTPNSSRPTLILLHWWKRANTEAWHPPPEQRRPMTTIFLLQCPKA